MVDPILASEAWGAHENQVRLLHEEEEIGEEEGWRHAVQGRARPLREAPCYTHAKQARLLCPSRPRPILPILAPDQVDLALLNIPFLILYM